MSILVWLLPIIVVTVLAALWTAWMARPRKPLGMNESMRAHQDFVSALERTRTDAKRGRS
ncbi:MAG TPA: hypothetical protein VHX59_19195 [Mycobacteriales bacterium]|jgi:hypothetical protein|nr:hypothetical protein [Mycobacteriales bacterium]